jgi:hypothetical protein
MGEHSSKGDIIFFLPLPRQVRANYDVAVSSEDVGLLPKHSWR